MWNPASTDVAIKQGRFRWKHTYDYSLECNTTNCQIGITCIISCCMSRCHHHRYYPLKDIAYSPGFVNYTGLHQICVQRPATKPHRYLHPGMTAHTWQRILSTELTHSLTRHVRSLNPLPKRSRPGWKVFWILFLTLDIIKFEAAIINISQIAEFISDTTIDAILTLQEEASGLLKAALQNLLALNVLFASQGDVCILRNATSCTYIDWSGHVVTEISTIRKNLQVLQEVEEWEWKGDWWGWLPDWMMVWKYFQVDLEADRYSITNHYNSLCAGAVDCTLPENGM